MGFYDQTVVQIDHNQYTKTLLTFNSALYSSGTSMETVKSNHRGGKQNIISSWPSHKKLFSPGSISVCYGKAITAEQAKKMGDEKLAEVLTDTLRQMQTKIRVKQGKKPYDY